MGQKYEQVNMFTEDVFPTDWDDEDIAFFAGFLEGETPFRLDVSMADTEYPYRLYRRVIQ